MQGDPLHQPYYCEENVWQLCRDPRLHAHDSLVAIIRGHSGHVACWRQRAAQMPTQPVFWDYHVILLEQRDSWQVWDSSSMLSLPCPASGYLAATFPEQERLDPRWRPRFRLLPAIEYAGTLASDRGHMRDPHGVYHHPPPPWPAPGEGRESNLARFIDLDQSFLGDIMDLTGLRRRLGMT